MRQNAIAQTVTSLSKFLTTAIQHDALKLPQRYHKRFRSKIYLDKRTDRQALLKYTTLCYVITVRVKKYIILDYDNKYNKIEFCIYRQQRLNVYT